MKIKVDTSNAIDTLRVYHCIDPVVFVKKLNDTIQDTNAFVSRNPTFSPMQQAWHVIESGKAFLAQWGLGVYGLHFRAAYDSASNPDLPSGEGIDPEDLMLRLSLILDPHAAQLQLQADMILKPLLLH